MGLNQGALCRYIDIDRTITLLVNRDGKLPNKERFSFSKAFRSSALQILTFRGQIHEELIFYFLPFEIKISFLLFEKK